MLGSRHGRAGRSWKIRHFTDQAGLSRVMNVGHVFFTGLFNVVYGTRLRDPFTMFKVFRRDCIHGLTFESNRFDFDWELVGKLVRAGYRPLEIPVNYQSRSFAEGKKVSFFRDPLDVVPRLLQILVHAARKEVAVGVREASRLWDCSARLTTSGALIMYGLTH